MNAVLTRVLARSETRFAIAGAWNTLVGYLVFLAVYSVLGESTGMMNILCVAYAISLLHAFVIQRFLVFKAKGAILRQFLRFAASNTLVFACNLIFLPLAIRWTDVSPQVLQGIFVLVSTALSFVLHKNYSFAR